MEENTNEKVEKKIDNRIITNKQRINKIDDDLEFEKARLKKMDSMQEELHALNKSLSKCIYLLSKSIKGPNTNVVFEDMNNSNHMFLENASATLEEEMADTKKNIHKLYEEKETIIQESRKKEQKEN